MTSNFHAAKPIENFNKAELRRPGIYMVKYIPDEEAYVGCSTNLARRVSRYTNKHWSSADATPWMKRKALRLMGYKPPLPLTRDIILPRECFLHIRQNISLFILEIPRLTISPRDLAKIEQEYINKLKPAMNSSQKYSIVCKSPWTEVPV